MDNLEQSILNHSGGNSNASTQYKNIQGYSNFLCYLYYNSFFSKVNLFLNILKIFFPNIINRLPNMTLFLVKKPFIFLKKTLIL